MRPPTEVPLNPTYRFGGGCLLFVVGCLERGFPNRLVGRGCAAGGTGYLKPLGFFTIESVYEKTSHSTIQIRPLRLKPLTPWPSAGGSACRPSILGIGAVSGHQEHRSPRTRVATDARGAVDLSQIDCPARAA
jgi:hypothetical protein